jgi:hypothetical protein
VAADVAAARSMNVDTERVPNLVEAGRFFGQADLERIRL